MKNVLMIAYYYPPFGGSAQRTLKFTKYLYKFNWNPIVVTVKGGYFYTMDASLNEDVPKDIDIVRTYSFEIEKLGILSKIRNKKEDADFIITKKTIPFHIKVMQFMRDFFCIPDEKIGWLPFALVESVKIIKKQKIEIIYSTSSPFTAHIVALLLKIILRKPWVTDFRDAWANNPTVSNPTYFHKRIKKMLEYMVLRNCDHIIANTSGLKSDFISLYSKIAEDKISVLYNGFDAADFMQNEYLNKTKNEKFTITHVGTFYKQQSPVSFLEALGQLFNKNPDLQKHFKIIFVGQFDFYNRIAVSQLINKYSLNCIEIVGQVNHKKSIEYLLKSDVLLLTLYSGQGTSAWIPSKLYEYLASNKYILALIENGNAAELIRTSKSGTVVSPNDIKLIENTIEELYSKWKNDKLDIGVDNKTVFSSFSRENLTLELSNILNKNCVK